MKLFVQLTNCGNPDKFQFSPVAPQGGKRVVNSFEEASKVCREYITYWNLGSGNWTGGKIWNTEGEFVGRVSFNGRIWDAEDKKVIA